MPSKLQLALVHVPCTGFLLHIYLMQYLDQSAMQHSEHSLETNIFHLYFQPCDFPCSSTSNDIGQLCRHYIVYENVMLLTVIIHEVSLLYKTDNLFLN